MVKVVGNLDLPTVAATGNPASGSDRISINDRDGLQLRRPAGTNVLTPVGSGLLMQPYVFQASIVNADPGAAGVRLTHTIQGNSTTIRISTTDSDGGSWTSAFFAIANTVNASKGYIRLQHRYDASKWLVFEVFAGAWIGTSYFNFTVSLFAFLTSSPFADGDPIVVSHAFPPLEGNPMTTAGDIVIGGASGLPTRLAKGSNGQYLRVNGSGVLEWVTLPVDPGFANPMTTSGDSIVGGASGAPTRLAVGGQYRLLFSATLGTAAAAWSTGIIPDAGSYRRFIVEVVGVQVAGTAGFLYMSLYEGATVVNTGYDGYIVNIKGGAAIPTTTAQQTTYWMLANDAGFEVNAWGWVAQWEVWNPHSNPKGITSRVFYRSSADSIARVAVSEGWCFGHSTPVTQFLIATTGANIAVGATWRVWGVPNVA